MAASEGAMRFIAVHLPCFRLERAGWDPSEPVVLHRFQKNAERVVALSPSALEAGIRPGMGLAEARALLPELLTAPVDEVGEARDLEDLAAALLRFAPGIRSVPAEGLLLEGDVGLLPQIQHWLRRLGHRARVVAAEEPMAAVLLSRWMPEDGEVRDLQAALGGLPVESLYGVPGEGLEDFPAFAETLQDVGVRKLRQLAALPLPTVVSRFGEGAGRLWALAAGKSPPVFRQVLPPEPLVAPRPFVEFDEPVEQAEALLFVAHGLLRELGAWLERQQRVVVRLGLGLGLDGGAPIERSLRPSWPTRQVDLLFRMVRTALEGIHLPAGVCHFHLELLEDAPWQAGTLGLNQRTEAVEPLGALVQRLEDVLGGEAVGRPALVERWLPEESWELRKFEETPRGEVTPENPRVSDPAFNHEPPVLPRPRPSLLLSEPVALRVATAPSGRPRAWMEGSQWVAFEAVEGPERLEGGWWEGGHQRDYWTVQLPGRRAWLYRSGERWFLHGWWDGPVPEFGADLPHRPPASLPAYAELLCRSNYSFVEGASHPEELVTQARELGLAGLALTDREGVYGAVRFHQACKKHGIKGVQGALLTVRLGVEKVEAGGEGASLVLLVQNLEGWSSLCRLITAAKAGNSKGRGELPFARLLEGDRGLILLLHGEWPESLSLKLFDVYGDRLYRAVARRYEPGEEERIDALLEGPIPLVATNDVLQHSPDRQPLQDTLTAIRTTIPVPELGRRRQPNAERSLQSPLKMLRRFARWPELLSRSVEILERCNFSLDEISYSYPSEVVPRGYQPMQWLRELVQRQAWQRYEGKVPEAVLSVLQHELSVIEQLDFSAYFLTIHDLVCFARRQGILCQGRGSAANSAVCYVLGITAVDPSQSQLLFERFLSPERGEPPDIDVDFEHERREEVIQYVYQKYGRHRAAMVNEVICWRGRMAVRDVGKALGFGSDALDRLAKQMEHWGSKPPSSERLRDAGLDPSDPRLGMLQARVQELLTFPRHTSIHVGGFVISEGPLVDRVPVEPATMAGRTVIQWDKDDVDAVKFVKVDLLSLGMLTAIRKAFDLIRGSYSRFLSLATVPKEDPSVYAMLQAGDSIGVFQVESRAQQAMLPRLKPKVFYDLVVEVSIVRPGPIQGGMVHPYLRRRAGKEKVEYAHEDLKPILERTLGVPIFQEQVMAMAVAVGGFTPGEADALRRSMGAWRRRGGMDVWGARLMAGMIRNGISQAYAEQIYKQIQGFAEYGFPESHAASFAQLVYVSAWLRRHYPAAFTAALLNSQPMGFYAPRTLVDDVSRHGVEVRSVDVQHSSWDCSLEEQALRLGLRMIKGFAEEDARRIELARDRGPFSSLPDLAVRTGLSRGALRRLARAGALVGVEAVRREASWNVEGLWPGLFAGLSRDNQHPLPEASPLEELLSDYRSKGFATPDGSGRNHPLGLLRPSLKGVYPIGRLPFLRAGQVVEVAGLVASRQRPATATGVLFLGLEDETGMLNVVVWPKLYEQERRLIRSSTLVKIRGVLQQQDGAVSLVAQRFWALHLEDGFAVSGRDFR